MQICNYRTLAWLNNHIHTERREVDLVKHLGRLVLHK